jgi:hypothetical protein
MPSAGQARAWSSLSLHTALAAGISALAQLQILAAMRGGGVQMRSLRCEKSKSSLRAKSVNHTHTAPLSTHVLWAKVYRPMANLLLIFCQEQ